MSGDAKSTRLTACPAGVNYAELFERARAEVERVGQLRNPKRNLIRWFAGDGRYTVLNGNEGIVDDNVDQSIANLCALASGAMVHTDRQIIEIIMSKHC